jgi:hypothetical protein
VTNAKLANVATATIKGRTTAGTGDPEDLTPEQARTVAAAAHVAGNNTFGGIQQLAIPGPFATDAEAEAAGVPDDNLYYRSTGVVAAATHISLDLQFAADKSLTARQGPTPTFTRASTATFVGSDGLIQSAAINEPRFDHDPVSLDCKGLLIEEARTNAIIQSDTLATQTITVTAVAHTLSFYGTGTVVLSGAHSATVVGTGAYPARTTLTFTPSAGSLILTVTGSVTQAQLEVGAFRTSYIPTTTAALTRSADVCSITGGDFTGFYNQSEGTVVSKLVAASGIGSVTQSPFSISTGSISNLIVPFRAVSAQLNQARLAVFVSGIYQAGNITHYGSYANSTSATIAIGLALNNFAGSLDGSISTDLIGTMPSPDRMFIGDRFDGARTWNGHISYLRYFKKRLPNAKLQTLTS